MNNNNLRKKVPSPLRVYNLFNRIYYRYFSDIDIRGGKNIKSISVETYLSSFITKHYHKIKTIDDLKQYILWVFRENGKIPITHLHHYIDGWKKDQSGDIKMFAESVVNYLKSNKMTLGEYVAPVRQYFPHIIQHYVGQKAIPFEFVIYTKAIQNVDKKNLDMLKVLLKDEFSEMDKHIKNAKKNKNFIKIEVTRIKELL